MTTGLGCSSLDQAAIKRKIDPKDVRRWLLINSTIHDMSKLNRGKCSCISFSEDNVTTSPRRRCGNSLF
ncbi:hypothetical protein GN958_ATG17276 [Phytophthora infestans]|uniref:Uncharacterized protein n=1 Tax=Phytophthora infestans TaxID=4787 RepID=A0A8S9U3R8_PHYIN|nr:hypothetical protein GN958_ATG17276 [Phytophthora infestans]